MHVSGSAVLAALAVVIPLIAAIAAAWIAKRSADRATAAQMDAAHMQRLEQRLATRKLEVYQPALDFLRQMLDDPKSIKADEFRRKFSEFAGWLAIVGSDEAVRSFGHFMQGTFNDAPPNVLLRLYAEFQLSARRDMGDPESGLTSLDMWALRLNDLYKPDGERLRGDLIRPFADVCREHSWTCPWEHDEVASDPGGGTPAQLGGPAGSG